MRARLCVLNTVCADLIKTRQAIDAQAIGVQVLVAEIQALRLTLSSEAKAVRLASQ